MGIDIKIIRDIADRYGFRTVPLKRGSAEPDYLFENERIMTTAKHKFDSYTEQQWHDFFRTLGKDGGGGG